MAQEWAWNWHFLEPDFLDEHEETRQDVFLWEELVVVFFPEIQTVKIDILNTKSCRFGSDGFSMDFPFQKIW